MDNLNVPPLFHEPALLGRCLSDHGKIWQIKLLDAGELSSFASRRGLESTRLHIDTLWLLGLLKADLLLSTETLTETGLTHVGLDDLGRHQYADERPPRYVTTGMVNLFTDFPSLPPETLPLFHPFRYYVLYHFDRILDHHASNIQMFLSTKGSHELLDDWVSYFENWSSSKEFLQLVDHWNSVASLAIMTEPCMYERLFKHSSRPILVNIDAFRAAIDNHCRIVTEVCDSIGANRIRELHAELCMNAQLLDPNKNIHSLLQLWLEPARLELEGRLGGAVCLLTMAEMLRRMEERATGEELPEESDAGIGETILAAKTQIYGSHRVLDDARARREFVRRFRFGTELRLRWYVEGYTELGALKSVIGPTNESGIEILNLRGLVVQKGALGFRDSLRADIEQGILSVVSLDEDVGVNVEAVRAAAKDDEICGAFFIASPDFAFGNFTRQELTEILWQEAAENGAQSMAREKLKDALQSASNETALLAAAKKSLPDELGHLTKNEYWGKLLMQFAMKYPDANVPSLALERSRGESPLKPVLDALRMALRARIYSYEATRRRYRVDAYNGLPTRRCDCQSKS